MIGAVTGGLSDQWALAKLSNRMKPRTNKGHYLCIISFSSCRQLKKRRHQKVDPELYARSQLVQMLHVTWPITNQEQSVVPSIKRTRGPGKTIP